MTLSIGKYNIYLSATYIDFNIRRMIISEQDATILEFLDGLLTGIPSLEFRCGRGIWHRYTIIFYFSGHKLGFRHIAIE